MAADSKEPDGPVEPVIVSGDRYADLAPYCGRIYALDNKKWRDVLPWEFPQRASKEQEEAFLLTYFSIRETQIQSFKFLKQAWYCIAMWNAQVKVPQVAEKWMTDTGIMPTDPEMARFVTAKAAKLETFFSPDEIAQYGEKLLRVVMQHLQWLVNSATRHDSGAEAAGAQQASVTAGDSATDSLQVPAQSDVTKSAVVPKVGLALSEHRVSGEQTAQEPVKRPRAGSSVDYTNYAPPPLQNRKRMNSNAKPSHNARTATAQQLEQQRGGANFGSSYQQSPHFNIPAPTIGNDRSFSNNMQPHQPFFQQRTASDAMPQYIQSPSAFQQQMAPVKLPSAEQYQGPPQPPGPYGQGMPQHSGPSGMPYEERHFQQVPPGFAPSHYHQHQHPQYQPQQQPVYYSNSQLNNHSNGNNGERQYDNGMQGGEDYGKQYYNRHESTSHPSRGGARPRGNSMSGKGKGSRGSRNSFNNGPRPDFNGGRRPSIDQNTSQRPDAVYYQNRRNSTFGGNWRKSGDQPQYQHNENVQPGRAFSGPDTLDQSASTPGLEQIYHPAAMPNAAQEGGQSFPRDLRRPSIASGSDSRHITQHSKSEARQHLPSEVSAFQKKLIYDEMQACPEKMITETSIGVDCDHVRKLVIFTVPFQVTEKQVGIFFERCGPVMSVKEHHLHVHDTARAVWIVFGDHVAASKALSMVDQKCLGDFPLKIKVPKEYWDITHGKFPGEGHPQYTGYTGNPRSAHQHQAPHTNKTSMQVPPSVPEHHEQQPLGGNTPTKKTAPDPTLHKELLSGSTTPTPSSGGTPKKAKNKSKSKKKSTNDLLTAAKASETSGADRDAVKAATGVQVDAVKGVEVKSTVPEPLDIDKIVESRGSLSTQSSEPAQTTSEIAFSPEAEFKARFPQPDQHSMPMKDNNADADQLFRATPATIKEEAGEAGSDDVAAGPPSDEAQKAESQTTGSGEAASNDAVNSTTDVAGSESPAKTNGEALDDSIHTAKGTPEHDQQSKTDRKRDRESEESVDTDLSLATARSRASTVIHRPETPSGDIVKKTSVTASEQSEASTAVSATLAENGSRATPDTLPASALSEKSKSQSDVAPMSPVSATSDSTAKSLPKKASVALPRVRIVEPPKSHGDGNAGDLQRTVSGTSIPPTPSFFTAPSTPALPAEIETTESDDVKIDEVTQQASKAAEKAEKSKGPAQTTSLLGSLFAKPQKQKLKKSKPQKGKGSIKGKPKAYDDAASEATSEGVMDSINENVATNAALPGPPASTPNADVDDKEQQDTDKRTSPQSSRDTSPSKARSALGKFGALVGGAMMGFGRSGPTAGTEKTVEEQPQSQPMPTVEKSASPVTKNESADGLTGTKNLDFTFTSNHGPPAPIASMATSSTSSGSEITRSPNPPFQFRGEGDRTGGALNSGDSGGGDVAEVGLGITAANDTGVDSADVNEEAKPKKKKKRSAGKKKKSKGTGAQEGEADAGQEDEAEILDGDEKVKAGGVYEMRRKSNGKPGFDLLRDDTSEATSRTLHSDAGSEASSRTLGRVSSREQTPSSTAAESSPHQSPLRLQNMIRKQNDLLVAAPSRLVMTRQKNNPSRSKTQGSEGEKDAEKTLYLEDDPMSSEGDDEKQRAGKQMDKLIDSVKKQQQQTMKENKPMLYVYLGPGKQEKKDEGGKQARVEEVEDEDEAVRKAAKRRVEREGAAGKA
ncbi:hypothetical protein LTR22_007688 [Elasticomyces elasticus]|nr:hypothetical protein LTR22_007688 [Elasticomyces elasticus]KAK4921069.1 hypothetical protein LTR49_011439 [Elasticomyces elasticus]KAK5752968.1 hypothetical protein LTS12_016939 [Elasticomyces elasticus]